MVNSEWMYLSHPKWNALSQNQLMSLSDGHCFVEGQREGKPARHLRFLANPPLFFTPTLTCPVKLFTIPFRGLPLVQPVLQI